MTLIKAENVIKSYRVGEVDVPAIRGVSFGVEAGSLAAFIGPSGSGKTTLLNMVGCLDRPDGGTLQVLDTDLGGLSRLGRAEFRGENLGFIFQDFNLLPVLTAYENVEYPLVTVKPAPHTERRERVMSALESVGIADHANKYPEQLSGGQKQRIAVARALVTRPRLVLADEPTANLDSATAFSIIELMRNMRDRYETTFVFSTHDTRIVDAVELIFELADGAIAQTRRQGAAA